MVDIKKLDYDKLKKLIHSKENIHEKKFTDDNGNTIKKQYSQVIFTFDCETTTYYYRIPSMIPEPFDKTKDKKYYKDMIKASEMYIFMIGINENVYYGRKIEEMKTFFCRLSHVCAKIIPIIYIHNLSFDINFIFNALEPKHFEMFSREANKPFKAYNNLYNIEFRCSLFLTNMSLGEVARKYNLESKKQEGLLDYIKIRTPYTILDDDEMKYCEYDIKVLYELIKDEKATYRSIYAIPLTQTGKVRRQLRKIYWKNEEYKDFVERIIPTTLKEYQLLEQVYSGGYTHANYTHANKLLKDLLSMDITSSYPSVMTCELYPMERFKLHKEEDCPNNEFLKKINRNKYAFIIDITLLGLKAKNTNSFLSVSKLTKYDDDGNKLIIGNLVEDNGRIRECDACRVKLIDVDFDTLKENYSIEKYKINKIWIAKKGYLDLDFILFILKLFRDKTVFDGVDDVAYRIAKELLNSLYGMLVTKFIIDDYKFDNGEYINITKTLSKEEQELKAQEKIDKHNEERNLMSWAWGVWCAGYARRNLWIMINKIGDDVVYSDTDSIKFLNPKKHEKEFDEYNKTILLKQAKICEYYSKLDITLFTAQKKDGKIKHLGYFTKDDYYLEFKTLGAKKYCYKHINKKNQEEIGITVAGLNKKKAVELITDIDKDFSLNKLFDVEHSGRLIAQYNNNQEKGIQFSDGWKSQCVYGVALMPTTYELGITEDYGQLIMSSDIMNRF